MKKTPPTLLSTFQTLVIVGRWLLVMASTVEMVVLLAFDERYLSPMTPPEALVFGLFLIYNIFSLALVHHVSIQRLPMVVLICLDLVFVGLASYYTGGSNSPFLEQCYLIIFVGALYYGLPGGTLTSFGSVFLIALLVMLNPAWLWKDVQELIPYFLISGILTGYLVRQLHLWFERYQESEVRARETEIREEVAHQEIKLARRMQMAVLPSESPKVPGLDIAARVEFAREVGGDFYLFITDENRLEIVVGDVSGKGFGPALISTSIVNMLPLMHPLTKPLAALVDLNHEMNERLPSDTFVTLSMVEISTDRSGIRLWNAGHPPALIYRAKLGKVVMSEIYNPGLGFMPDWQASPESADLDVGDVLLIYTDGLIETRSADKEHFEEFRTAEVLERNAHRGANEIADEMVKALNLWGEVTDDLTILVVKRTEIVAVEAETPEPPVGAVAAV